MRSIISPSATLVLNKQTNISPSTPAVLERLLMTNPIECRAQLEATIADDMMLACYIEMLEAEPPNKVREPLHDAIRVDIMRDGLELVSDEVIRRLIRDGEALAQLGFDVIPFIEDRKSYWHGKGEGIAKTDDQAEWADLPICSELIRSKVHELARRIEREYAGKQLMITPVLTGGLVFAMDLFRGLTGLSPSLDPIVARSYDGTRSRQIFVDSGMLDRLSFQGRHVLIVDDILDTGQTLTELTRQIGLRGPASVKTCVFLQKQRRRFNGIAAIEAKREFPFEPNYVGFRIPDIYVVGYGLDYLGAYRSLPDIVALNEKAETSDDPKGEIRISVGGADDVRWSVPTFTSLGLDYTGTEPLEDVEFTVVAIGPGGESEAIGLPLGEMVRKPIKAWHSGERQSISIDGRNLGQGVEVVRLTLEARVGNKPVRTSRCLSRNAIRHGCDGGDRPEHFWPISTFPSARLANDAVFG